MKPITKLVIYFGTLISVLVTGGIMVYDYDENHEQYKAELHDSLAAEQKDLHISECPNQYCRDMKLYEQQIIIDAINNNQYAP